MTPTLAILYVVIALAVVGLFIYLIEDREDD